MHLCKLINRFLIRFFGYSPWILEKLFRFPNDFKFVSVNFSRFQLADYRSHYQ